MSNTSRLLSLEKKVKVMIETKIQVLETMMLRLETLENKMKHVMPENIQILDKLNVFAATMQCYERRLERLERREITDMEMVSEMPAYYQYEL